MKQELLWSLSYRWRNWATEHEEISPGSSNEATVEIGFKPNSASGFKPKRQDPGLPGVTTKPCQEFGWWAAVRRARVGEGISGNETSTWKSIERIQGWVWRGEMGFIWGILWLLWWYVGRMSHYITTAVKCFWRSYQASSLWPLSCPCWQALSRAFHIYFISMWARK